MSSSVEDLADTLNTVQYSLYRYVLPPFIALGSVGNLFNLIIFLQPYLRTNPCSIYLLAYTIVSFCWIDFVALTASLTIGFSNNIGIQSTAACCIRTYIIYVTINLLPDFLILAALDRTFVSAKRFTLRQYSTIKVAVYSICGVTLFWILFNIPALFYTDIIQVGKGETVCTPLPGNSFNNFIFVFFAISYGLLPPIILVILGCITLKKLVHILKQVLPINELSQVRLNEKERQLIIMLLSHMLLTVLCQSPSSIYQVYAIVTLNFNKSYERQIIELFTYNMCVLFLFLPACLSFYVYFARTKTFRHEFKNVIKQIRCFQR